MVTRMLTRRLLLAPHTLRNVTRPCSTAHIRLQTYIRYSSSLQSVTQPLFWTSLVPKPLRRTSPRYDNAKKPKPKTWNPATFYIIIFLLIGSMSIQMIALRNSFTAFSRRADAKLDLLREVIERIQRGEEVDVEGLLGTGDPLKEKEWEEVLKKIEDEEALWTESQRKKPKLFTQAKRSSVPPAETTTTSDATNSATGSEITKPKTMPYGFY